MDVGKIADERDYPRLWFHNIIEVPMYLIMIVIGW